MTDVQTRCGVLGCRDIGCVALEDEPRPELTALTPSQQESIELLHQMQTWATQAQRYVASDPDGYLPELLGGIAANVRTVARLLRSAELADVLHRAGL